MNQSELLARLRGEPQHLRSLVTLLFDDLLDRKVEEVLPPRWLAERIAVGVAAAAEKEGSEEWIRARLDQTLTRLEEEESLRSRLSEESVERLRGLVGRPMKPNEALVRGVLDHEAMRGVMREVLLSTLADFGQSLRIPPPQASNQGRGGRFGRLSGLAAAAQGVASNVGAMVEKQLEGKVEKFVDGAIGGVVDLAVESILAESTAEQFAKWRLELLEQGLDLNAEELRGELEKLEVDRYISDGVALWREVARFEGLEEVLGDAFELTASQFENLRELLDGPQLEDVWRPDAEALAFERARDFVASERFEGWLSSVMGE